MEGDLESTRSAITSGGDVVRQPLFDAMRELLWVLSPDDARNVARDLVEGLGGTIADSDDFSASAIPIDLSFGAGPPILPYAAEHSVARMQLERYLPSFAIDVRRILQLHAEIERNQEDASLDSLTQLSNRRMTGRALGRLQPGEIVMMIDLDHFKVINDSFGHVAGDQVLRAFGRALLSALRGRDFAGRYGGEEFVVVLPGDSDPEPFLERLRELWTRVRPYVVTFSAGISLVGDDVTTALVGADAAMYRAKNAGRDQWSWATERDHLEVPTTSHSVRANREASQFVAYSRLEIPEGHQEQFDKAFRDRLGAVDAWPGFIALEVWADTQHPTQYSMVSWWTSVEAFQNYMKSSDHQLSHDRIPTGSHRPKPTEFRRYRMVAH
ncbi:MAG: diguanylate cyclase domain-containing protein [Acidimicrobiales bacterium]